MAYPTLKRSLIHKPGNLFATNLFECHEVLYAVITLKINQEAPQTLHLWLSRVVLLVLERRDRSGSRGHDREHGQVHRGRGRRVPLHRFRPARAPRDFRLRAYVEREYAGRQRFREERFLALR